MSMMAASIGGSIVLDYQRALECQRSGQQAGNDG
jgi:hypothetical protein